MTKATLAKIFGAVAAIAVALQGFISEGSFSLPHTAAGWLSLVAGFAVYWAAHHASGTDGTN